MGISSKIAGIELSNCVMNGSGPSCTTLEELLGIANSSAGAIVLKSATFEPREGNPEPRYYEHEFGTINSMGLPNPGYKELAKLVPELKKKGKPIIASIAGFNKEEYLEMLREKDSAGADILEINLSCPNVVGKSQAGYDFEYSREVLGEARKITKKPIAVKLPPYLDLAHQQAIAEVLLETKTDIAVLVNSLGNCLIVDSETEKAAIKPKRGRGGLGGKYIKPVALGNVLTFSELLGDKVDIVGAGGIYSGTDAFEHILCGAKAVQVSSAYAMYGPGVFDSITRQLEKLMERKGYNGIEDFRGKLREAD